MPELPNKLWLSRKVVLVAVGNWRRLAALERAGLLHREYPAGLKHARYRRAEVVRVLKPESY